ncbi:PBSX family phage terminase large subunit [Lentilactobacillus kribbianus]|uniref:PBSX family phage terminase large subunit n=1 Tax=Lentilactobacillus kribbianus TaxID=2729622 RepID=UPI001554437B|nr:PBSX family phage terminase large subunit [Lentilactobacillus kribbianus]
MSETQLNITSMINPHFYKLWRTKKPYVVAKGGRGSFKSSTISLKLVMMMKKQAQLGHKANVICIRENTVNLRDSVYGQIVWALDMLHMTNEFSYAVSPMRITHKSSGSTFYFYGGDKPEKLKSNTVRNVIAVWYEEAANFKSAEVFDQTNPTFIRQQSPFVNQVQIFYSYNPPRNPYSWINKWVETVRNDDDYLIDHSTYLDDELNITNKQQLKLIEAYKNNDRELYRYLYLGEAVGLGTNIYNMTLFHPLKSLPDDEYLVNIYFSQDSGQQVSATTESCYGLTNAGKVILLNTYYYSPVGKSNKKAPSDIAKDLHEVEHQWIRQWGMNPWKKTADSATSDFALDHEMFKEYPEDGRYHHVAKTEKTKMIDNVQNLLGTGRFYYLDIPENEIFIKEHQQYRWDDKTIQSDKPKVIKENDHTCDAFMYLIMDNLVDFGLKW